MNARLEQFVKRARSHRAHARHDRGQSNQALRLIADQAERVQKLGKQVVTEIARQRALDAIWAEYAAVLGRITDDVVEDATESTEISDPSLYDAVAYGAADSDDEDRDEAEGAESFFFH